MYRYLIAHLFSNLSRISRRAVMRSAGVAFVAIVISGCGNKGDLYLPEDVSTTYQALGSSKQSFPIQSFPTQSSPTQSFPIQSLPTQSH
jgi:predicted small lipoprotein YifL